MPLPEDRRDLMQEAEIPLALERQQMAVEKAKAVFDAAQALLATGILQAVGYRVMVKPLEVGLGLEVAEAAKSPTLADADFQVKSQNQREREEKGSNVGVVMHLGPIAYDRLGGATAWAKVGDVVVFSRYAGTRREHPPGSGVFYQLMNDEDIFGKVI